MQQEREIIGWRVAEFIVDGGQSLRGQDVGRGRGIGGEGEGKDGVEKSSEERRRCGFVGMDEKAPCG